MFQAMEQWSNPRIHDTVAAIARQPIYSDRQSLAGRVLRYIVERIGDFIALFKGSGNGRLILIAGMVVVALLIAARIALSTRVDQRRRRTGAAARGAATRTDHWAAASAFAAVGDFVAASHELYAGVLESLSRAGAVKFHSSKTSGDYARELRRARSPGVQDFRSFARQCDRIIYGTHTPTDAEYQSVSDAAQRGVRAAIAA
jgi:hypothetical protein